MPGRDTDDDRGLGIDGLGAEDEPGGLVADSERDDPLVSDEDAPPPRAGHDRPGHDRSRRDGEPGDDGEGQIQERSGHGDRGPLGKEI